MFIFFQFDMQSPTLKPGVEFEWGDVLYKSITPHLFRNTTSASVSSIFEIEEA